MRRCIEKGLCSALAAGQRECSSFDAQGGAWGAALSLEWINSSPSDAKGRPLFASTIDVREEEQGLCRFRKAPESA